MLADLTTADRACRLGLMQPGDRLPTEAEVMDWLEAHGMRALNLVVDMERYVLNAVIWHMPANVFSSAAADCPTRLDALLALGEEVAAPSRQANQDARKGV